MDFRGWRDKDDSDPTKKRARILRGLATMEHKATCGNSFVDGNDLPSLQTQFGKGHARSRSKKMKAPAKAAGKAFLKELKSFMSFTQGGVIESVADRKQRFTTFVVAQSSNATVALQKINASEQRRSQYVHVPCGTPLPIEHRDDFIDALPISSSASAPPPRAMEIGPCQTSKKKFATTPKGLYPVGSCRAMQSVSNGHELFYSQPETYNISTMTDMVFDRTPGVVLLDKHGHVEALRLEKDLELNETQQKHLVNLFKQATRVCVKLGRGQSTLVINVALVINVLNWIVGSNAKDPLLPVAVGSEKDLLHKVYATLAVGKIPDVRLLRRPLVYVCCTKSVTTAPVCTTVSMPLTVATSRTSIVSITAIRTNRKGSGRG